MGILYMQNVLKHHIKVSGQTNGNDVAIPINQWFNNDDLNY